MHRTLLLCFIHGFQGSDNTFGGFPEHIAALIHHALPNITVKSIVYPQFETRGDLIECVARFREWLQNKVIDLEVAAGTPSPTIDPSVHVVLCGHSMGGIVAAETLLSIVSDEPVKPTSTSKAATNTTMPAPSMGATTNASTTGNSVPPNKNTADTTSGSTSRPPSRPSTAGSAKSIPKSGTSTPGFMFPHIAGILAFDTPYLGISPGVIAYGAESQYQTASSAYNALTSAASAFGWGSASSTTPQPQTSARQLPMGPAAQAMKASADAAAAPAWQNWGRYAMFAGAAGAVLAGGAAAYVNRDSLTQGWGWVGSHLEFVGCLVRGEELKQRVAKVVALSKTRGIGFSDMFTVLGEGAGKTEGITIAGGWVEVGGSSGTKEARGRTFCSLPQNEEWKCYFEGTTNDKMAGEIQAHCAMFFPKDNPGYYDMSQRAKKIVVKWVNGAWYRGSSPQGKQAAEFKAGGVEGEPMPVD